MFRASCCHSSGSRNLTSDPVPSDLHRVETGLGGTSPGNRFLPNQDPYRGTESVDLVFPIVFELRIPASCSLETSAIVRLRVTFQGAGCEGTFWASTQGLQVSAASRTKPAPLCGNLKPTAQERAALILKVSQAPGWQAHRCDVPWEQPHGDLSLGTYRPTEASGHVTSCHVDQLKLSAP